MKKFIILVLLLAVLSGCAEKEETAISVPAEPSIVETVPPAEPQEVETAPIAPPPADVLQAELEPVQVEETMVEPSIPEVVEEVAAEQPLTEDTPIIIESAKTDIPEVVEHAKTGYEDEDTPPTEPPVVEPEQPADPADIGAAIAAAEAFAIETYHVTIDPSLDFTNSAYRFPAVVPLMADQETLNNKAIDIVNYTFQQQIRQYGVTIEKMRESGIRCKVHIEQSSNDLMIYCLHA